MQKESNLGQKYKTVNFEANFPLETLLIHKWSQKWLCKQNNNETIV